MANYHCEYCGTKYSSVSTLTSASCMRHPNGSYKGKYKLYQGSEKPQYTCKHCGTKYTTLSILTSGSCMRHTNGAHKGKHAPAL